MESYITATPDRVTINSLERLSGNLYGDTQINAFLRCDGLVGAENRALLYDYLNAKY